MSFIHTWWVLVLHHSFKSYKFNLINGPTEKQNKTLCDLGHCYFTIGMLLSYKHGTSFKKLEGNGKNAEWIFTGQWVHHSWHHIYIISAAQTTHLFGLGHLWWTLMGSFFPSDFPTLSTNHRSSSVNGTLGLGGVTYFIIQGLTNLEEKKTILFSILFLIYIMILGGNSIIIYVVQRTVYSILS